MSYTWTAQLKTGLIINQYNDQGEEVRFRYILDQQQAGEIAYFSLKHNQKPLVITVDLTKGFIFTEGQVDIHSDFLTPKKDIRLIYFKRNSLIWDNSTNWGNTLNETSYWIGYQYLDEHGRNKKVLVQLLPSGQLCIGG